MDLKTKISATALTVFFVGTTAVGIVSCKPKSEGPKMQKATPTEAVQITKQEVMEVQKAWGEGIVSIGKVYSDKGDYKTAATEHINKFYNYNEGTVLFKPTLTYQKQFRNDFEGALSYFVGGNSNYPEDKGFALKMWSAVRWENAGIEIVGNTAMAMGNYYFTPAKGGDEVKVEYSFVYTKDKDGNLKIILHDSHIPYSPE